MTQKLAGKVALVTGSGRGIGRCIALKLASEGARLVVNDLEAGPAEEVVALIRERGGEAVACVGSVTAPDFADRFIKTALQSFQGLDIKVGISPDLARTFESGIPLGRAGTPEEAADAVYLLCTPESNYISGQTVVCGGGLAL